MKLRILDKYLFKEVFMTFLFGICAFSAVFIGSGTLFRIAKYITDYGATLPMVVKIFVYSLPTIIIWTFPMSMLLASLMTYGRMSGSSEITAMKSCGISFYRIAAPAVVLGLMVSLFSIWFNEEVVPRANRAYDNTVEYEIKGHTAPASQEHVIIKEISSSLIKRIVYARRYDSKTNRMEHITMQMFEEGKLKTVENAAYAEWLGDSWLMHDGVIYEVQDDNVKAHNSRFDTQLLPVNMTPRRIMESQKEMEEMSRSELREQIKILQEQYVDTKKLEAELAQRYTVPMASLIFALVGVPLGMQPNRHSSSAGFALSVIIIFSYYAGMVMASALARGGALPPTLAVWLPNLISGAVGYHLVRKAAR
ncbi:MAG: LptF/LptG family permease [Selenomonadaceae bacterium]|nr:LptF/LptG family permease [Selenomonadaceae bacterium]